MPFRNASKTLALATLITLAACSSTKPGCNLPEPPADMMQPPEVTDFLTPLSEFLGLQPPAKDKPAN